MKLKMNSLYVLLLCGTQIFAQTITVKKQYTLIKKTQSCFYPTLNKAGNKVLFTDASYTGLKMCDLSTKEVSQLSDEPSAGYEPIFDSSDSKVFYRSASFQNGRKLDALMSVDLIKKQKNQVLSPQRNLKQARNSQDGFVVSSNHQLLKASYGKRVKSSNSLYVCSEELNIVLYRNGNRIVLNPIVSESGSYVWVSLSPDNTKILFTAARKGTFICDLNGKIIKSFGKLNAPIWYDDNFVVGMQDQDNGHLVTASKVMMMSVNGKVKKQISLENQIAMYPSASALGGKVAYNTLEGSIEIVELSIK